MGKLIIDGNQVYELDEDCMKQKEKERNQLEENKKWKEGNWSEQIYAEPHKSYENV
ncbi:MAG: hypothetical protein MR355_07185 [Lachnospiraceae bacterium]|nr:hypothetical protein [Lachnospiraceae bacterium]